MLLVDPTHLLPDVANLFAYDLYANYHLQTDRYAYDAEWTGFAQLATALAQAIEALAADAMPGRENRFAIAHDWMGLLPVLALQLQGADRWSTVYYAHEVAPVRRLVEEHEGHDTRYYNVMRKAEGSGVFLDNVFGSQNDWFKVPLLHQASRCDAVLAVSDLIREELRFLGTGFADAPIDLVYNGIPSQATTLDEKNRSRDRLRSYCREPGGRGRPHRSPVRAQYQHWYRTGTRPGAGMGGSLWLARGPSGGQRGSRRDGDCLLLRRG